MADEEVSTQSETQVTPADLTVVNTIVDGDKIMVTHANGTTEVIQGNKLKDYINGLINTLLTNQMNVYEETITSNEYGTATFRYVKQGKVVIGRIYFQPNSSSQKIFDTVKIPAPSVQCIFRVRDNNTSSRYDIYVGNNGAVYCGFTPTANNSYSGMLSYVIN